MMYHLCLADFLTSQKFQNKMADMPDRASYQFVVPQRDICLVCSKNIDKQYRVFDKFGGRGVAYNYAVYFFGNEFANVPANRGTYLCQNCYVTLRSMQKKEQCISEQKQQFQETCQKLDRLVTKHVIPDEQSATSGTNLQAQESNMGAKSRLDCGERHSFEAGSNIYGDRSTGSQSGMYPTLSNLSLVTYWFYRNSADYWYHTQYCR